MSRSLAMLLRCGALLLGIFAPLTAQAAFHFWSISELFSNHDGSVQFIELVSSGPNETVAVNAEIRTTSANPDHVFDFPQNLIGNTLNKRLLIATPGFASLPGAVTPDFTLPALQTPNFFNAAGDTIRLFQPTFGEFHSRTFTSVPTDGVMSRHFPPLGGTLLTNSPTNFAGQIGAINVPPPPAPTGDYNGDDVVDAADYVVWRKTLNQSATPTGSGADGNSSGTIDAGDYTFWRTRFGNVVTGLGSGNASAPAAAPEPATFVLAVVGLAGFGLFCMPRRVTRRSGRDPRHVDVRRKVRPSRN